MPVRLCPMKVLLITYDSQRDHWVTLEGLSFLILSEYVDIEPGVTIQHVFDLIDRHKGLKRFLCEYCACDINAVRREARRDLPLAHTRMGVERDAQGNWRRTELASIDTVVVSPLSFAFTDDAGERRLESSFELL